MQSKRGNIQQLLLLEYLVFPELPLLVTLKVNVMLSRSWEPFYFTGFSESLWT